MKTNLMEIFARDTEFERDWSDALGAPLGDGDGHTKELNFFFSFRDFSGKSR